MDASNTCTRSKIGAPMEENLGLLKTYWCNRRINQPDCPIDSGLQLSQVVRLSSDWFSAYRPNSRSMVLATSQVQIAAIMAAWLWLAAFYMRPGSLNVLLKCFFHKRVRQARCLLCIIPLLSEFNRHRPAARPVLTYWVDFPMKLIVLCIVMLKHSLKSILLQTFSCLI